MRYIYYVTALLVVLTISIAGFRGRRSTQPPVEVFPDMDRQAKYKPQGESKFFADGRADRPLPRRRGAARAHDRRRMRIFCARTIFSIAARRLPASSPGVFRRSWLGREVHAARERALHDLLRALSWRPGGRAGDHEGLWNGDHGLVSRRPHSQNARGGDFQHDHQREEHDVPVRRQTESRGPLGGNRLRARPRARPPGHAGRRSGGSQGGAGIMRAGPAQLQYFFPVGSSLADGPSGRQGTGQGSPTNAQTALRDQRPPDGAECSTPCAFD